MRMKQVIKNLLVSLALLPFAVATAAGQRAADKAYTCFPTCSETDGRMLTLAGSGLFTLGGDSISMKLVISGSDSSFDIGLFDGDSGPPHWDRGVDELRFSLYADPMGDGSGTVLVGEWSSNGDNPNQGPRYNTFVNGSRSGRMPDNEWFDITIDVAREALAAPNSECPPDDYCYLFVVESARPRGDAESNFKVRTTGEISLRPVAFSFVGAVRSMSDLTIIYPEYPSLAQTTYDGNWEFLLRLDRPSSVFTVWDGDFDYGSYDCRLMDTDDPDTCVNVDSGCMLNSFDGSSLVPAWANGTAAFTEGVAYGNLRACGRTTGMPNDDQDPLLLPELPGIFSRPPAVHYQLETPVGTFMNLNPSGNQEWEQFRLDTNLDEPADYYVPELPAGEYRLKIFGLDAANLNALRVSAVILGRRSASLGGRVWSDMDGDGIQDPGEPGINNVEVRLYRESRLDGILKTNQDDLIAVQTTSGDGNYNFLGLGAGRYWIDIVESTLPLGAVLTTANEPYLPGGGYALAEEEAHSQADFGYALPSIGDLVWNDNNMDGVFQPDGEVGIRGVTVELEGDVDGDGIVDRIQTQTDSEGYYLFSSLALGNYIVRVAPQNFGSSGPLRSATPTYDFDRRLDHATSTNLPITGGIYFPLADFGYYRDCASCKGKVGALRLRFTGSLPDSHIRVLGTQGPQNGVVFFDGVVQPNEIYNVFPVPGAKHDDLGVSVRFYLNGVAEADLDTNCSKEVGPGTVVGSSVVVEGWSKKGDLICPAP